MTLNQVISRIRTIALSHQQLRNFYFGSPVDFLTDKKTLFPSCFAEDDGGQLQTAGKEYSLNLRIYFLDLVTIGSKETLSGATENELEVQSDMLSVAKDIVALMNASTYTDWALTTSMNYQLIREEDGDIVAGVVLSVTIRTQWDNSYCEAPTN